VTYVDGPFWPIDTSFYIADDSGQRDIRYVYYLLKTLGLEQMNSDSAVPGLNRDNAHALEVRVPSISSQIYIADILQSFDDRITLLRETNATLEAIAQTLFKSWFVDFDPVRAKMEGRTPEGMDEATAALFPDSFEPSELGEIPSGWRVSKFEDFIQRLPVGKKFDQKSAEPIGSIPILDQGRSGIIGYHNESPGVVASLDEPVVVFANHTCYMRLISFNFSAIQNVLPFKGSGVDTVWAYYATQGRVKHSEYKGHWPDFAIEKSVVPSLGLSLAFREVMDPIVRQLRLNELQIEALAELRDTLLPRLISGQLRLPEAEKQVIEALA
jgi:type I restriction enzyme S subunit